MLFKEVLSKILKTLWDSLENLAKPQFFVYPMPRGDQVKANKGPLWESSQKLPNRISVTR